MAAAPASGASRPTSVTEAAGWFFTFVLEFEAVQSLKEVLPVFVRSDGVVGPRRGQWLLSRSQRIKHEDRGDAPLPAQGDAFEAAVQRANTMALEHATGATGRTSSRRIVIALHQERDKLERFYEYKRMAARRRWPASGERSSASRLRRTAKSSGSSRSGARTSRTPNGTSVPSTASRHDDSLSSRAARRSLRRASC